MPYEQISDLPETIRRVLPRHAQEIYLKAFNNAWTEYADPTKRRGGISHEETAHRVAWNAVKKVYTKDIEGTWHRRS